MEEGGAAVFLVPVHFEGNSVQNGYSGGAFHTDGEVSTISTICLPCLPAFCSHSPESC